MKFSIYIKRKDMDVNEHYTQTHIKVKEQHFLSNFCFVSQRVRINFIFPTMYVYCVKVIMQCKENKRQKNCQILLKMSRTSVIPIFFKGVLWNVRAILLPFHETGTRILLFVIPLSLKRPRYTVTVSWNRYQDIVICHSTL